MSNETTTGATCEEKAGLILGLLYPLMSVILLFVCQVNADPELSATIIDRFGNTHQIERLTYQGRNEIEVYIRDQRRLIPLNTVKRLRFEGEKSDELQKISLTMRSGNQETGQMFSGASTSIHQDAVGGGSSGRQFVGVTSLGPFFIFINDVRELIIEGDGYKDAPKESNLRATIITTEGARIEVGDLRFRGKQRLDFLRGRNKRFIPLAMVNRIDFDDSGHAKEFRPITATYRNGRTVMGTVDISTVRLSGETDRSYHNRVHSTLTGTSNTGSFAIGIHLVKQIRFVIQDSSGSK